MIDTTFYKNDIISDAVMIGKKYFIILISPQDTLMIGTSTKLTIPEKSLARHPID